MTHTSIFTFCFEDAERRHKYAQITADTEEETREAMFARFGEKWAFQYDAALDKTREMILEFNLTPFCIMDTSADTLPLFIDPVFAVYYERECEAILYKGAPFCPVPGFPLIASTHQNPAELQVLSYDEDTRRIMYDVQMTPRRESPFDADYIETRCQRIVAERADLIKKAA